MSIKLNGATNGSVELDVPAAIGSDLSVTIPATAGELTVKATDGSVDLGAIDIAASAPADSVNLDSSGNVGIGTTSPTQKLHIYDTNTAYLQLTTAGSTQTASGGFQLIHNGAGDLRANIVQRENAPMTFLTNDIERMRIDSGGGIFAYNLTGSASAGAALKLINNEIVRDTSSIQFKKDVEDIEESYAANLLDNARPVWFRGKDDKQNPEHSYWGFIAEELAEVEPRLCVFEDGAPFSVDYGKFSPLLLKLIQMQNEKIKVLETRLTSLEGGAS